MLHSAGVGRVSASESGASLESLAAAGSNARGISADGTHAYWTEGNVVFAVPIGGGMPITIHTVAAGVAVDTASTGAAVYVTTSGPPGELVRIDKTVE